MPPTPRRVVLNSANKVGRCSSSWLNCDYTAVTDMTFANNLLDWSYNPGNIAGSHDSATSGFLSRWAFSNNTWVLGTALNELYQLVTGGGAGTSSPGRC
jgi:hypothetical protein